jgi:hypothetical protein
VQKRRNTEDDGSMQQYAPLDLFKGRHFDQEIVVLCVRWYLSFKLRVYWYRAVDKQGFYE